MIVSTLLQEWIKLWIYKKIESFEKIKKKKPKMKVLSIKLFSKHLLSITTMKMLLKSGKKENKTDFILHHQLLSVISYF